MSYGICLVFDQVGEDAYWRVNDLLGINRDGSGDWPAGLLNHSCGTTATGLIVNEVWESKAAAEEFAHGRLGAALQAAAVAPPVQVIDSTVINALQPAPA